MERYDDKKRLDWIFQRLNDTGIRRRVDYVSEVHASGAFYDIHMGDFRHAIDVAMQTYKELH